ncbi:type II secretion system protein, partial [Campylobacter sp. RM12637]|nr:type II secretion system protein [Campylobacter sp. RM12637]
MKKGFTMIELIFVIVILGILAAVAIPKLNATRDDAELAKAASNFSTVISDISSYYTAKGSFATKLSDMTNVGLDGGTTAAAAGAGATGELKIKDKKCIKFEAKDSTLKIGKGTDSAQTICTNFYAISSVKAITGNTDVPDFTSAYEI